MHLDSVRMMNRLCGGSGWYTQSCYFLCVTTVIFCWWIAARDTDTTRQDQQNDCGAASARVQLPEHHTGYHGRPTLACTAGFHLLCPCVYGKQLMFGWQVLIIGCVNTALKHQIVGTWYRAQSHPNPYPRIGVSPMCHRAIGLCTVYKGMVDCQTNLQSLAVLCTYHSDQWPSMAADTLLQ